jgi:hypothetical protein
VRDELLIQIQEFIIHHYVDDEETKSVEMKNRVFRAHMFLSIESTDFVL